MYSPKMTRVGSRGSDELDTVVVEKKSAAGKLSPKLCHGTSVRPAQRKTSLRSLYHGMLLKTGLFGE